MTVTSPTQDAIDNRTDDFSVMLQLVFGEQMKGIHTQLPGVIEEFDADTQRAKVAMANALQLEGGETKGLPALVDVPVQFYRWGNFAITAPPTEGCECLILFSERSLARFKKFGDIGQPPADARFFDLSDGFCIPGTMSEGKALENFNTSDIEIRTIDGTTKLAIGDSSLTYADGSVDLSVSGDKLTFSKGGNTFEVDAAAGTYELKNTTAELVDLLSQLLQALSVETVTVAGVPLPFTNAATYTLLKTSMDTLKA